MVERTDSNEKTEVYKPSMASRVRVVWRELRKSRLAFAGFSIVVFMVIVALFAPMITPYEPTWMGPSRRPPSMQYPFGTDGRGRDMLTLVVHGATISLYVGLASVLIEILIGVAIGMFAGYFGGLIDDILMRVTDIIMTLPTLVLLIVAVAMLEVRSIHVIVLVMGVFGWPFMARVVRSEFLQLRESTYVEAATSMGASSWRITIHHILPNTFSSIIVIATMDIPWYIFYEATLTFLGFGDPSSPSWGVLLEIGYYYLGTQWWIITFPGLALFFTSLGFNLFGDGLRDALDVTQRGR